MNVRVEKFDSVALITLSRPPHNFFDVELLMDVADALASVDQDPHLRASVLASDQKHFCAGADFGGGAHPEAADIGALAIRLFGRKKTMIAAVNGSAIGGGLGVAMVADFRVGEPSTRLQANFVRLGISPGFGLSHTLPHTIGQQKARDLLMTGRRVEGDEALTLGLLDRLAAPSGAKTLALALAAEVGASSPRALAATRRLLTSHEKEQFARAIEAEIIIQQPLLGSDDLKEAVVAMKERRPPNFAD